MYRTLISNTKNSALVKLQLKNLGIPMILIGYFRSDAYSYIKIPLFRILFEKSPHLNVPHEHGLPYEHKIFKEPFSLYHISSISFRMFLAVGLSAYRHWYKTEKLSKGVKSYGLRGRLFHHWPGNVDRNRLDILTCYATLFYWK